MNHKVALFLDGLISYDYILFGSVFALFILFIVLSILLRKNLFFALLSLFLGFAVLILGPTLGYIKMHEYLFKNSLILESQKKLTFTKAVVVKGKIQNESQFNFSRCKITASSYKLTNNQYKNYLFKLRPFQKASIYTSEIPKGTSATFKIFIEPFTYSQEYNISLKADCK